MNNNTLTNWSVVADPRNPYLAPECRKMCLAGQREDGATVITSVIVGKTAILGGFQRKVVTTSGSRYLLLEVDPEYEARYPNAMFRVMESLTEVK